MSELSHMSTTMEVCNYKCRYKYINSFICCSGGKYCIVKYHFFLRKSGEVSAPT
jgi:hypothetical protein